MSIEALNWAKRQICGCPGRKAVLLALADRADEAWSCFPSVPLIATEMELCDRSVQRHLRQLAKDEIIHIEARPGKRSRYTLAPGVTPDMLSPVTPDTVTGDSVSPPTKSAVTPDKNDTSPTPPIKINPQEPKGDDVVGARARQKSDLELICEAAGPGLASIQAEPQITLSAPIVQHWKGAGADLHLDIIPVIAALTREPRDPPIKSLRFFNTPVRKHVAERLAEVEPIKPGEARGSSRKPRRIDVDAMVDAAFDNAAARRAQTGGRSNG